MIKKKVRSNTRSHLEATPGGYQVGFSAQPTGVAPRVVAAKEPP